MKTIAYTALHYGKDYLGYAIQSVIDYVDEYWVLYSAVGSHGFRTNVPCPDTREELYWLAQQVAGDKLHWVDGTWAHEGLQRNSITEHCPDADVILVLDADEIWHPALAEVAIGHYWQCIEHDAQPNFRCLRLPIIHHWRSFYRAILHDPAYPVRVIYPKVMNGEYTNSIETYTKSWGWPGLPVIYHMGYAQRPEIVQYKMLTHGHRNELRTDINWFQERYLANAQTDCHPVGSEFWNTESFDPWQFMYMPVFMKSHPYAKMEVIE